MLAGLMVVILTVLDQPIHAECPRLPDDHPGHYTNKKPKSRVGFLLQKPWCPHFPASTVSVH